MSLIIYIIIGLIGIVFILGIRIVRPTHRMLIETLGKYSKTAEQGFHWIIPIIQRGIYVNITKQMADIPEQTVQTSDKLNTIVDAMVYYEILDVKKSEYGVNQHRRQLTSLARTNLRAVMGNMTLTECIKDRETINSKVETALKRETTKYGVDILMVEVQRIEPPKDVQESMNNVVKAEQEKIAALDRATATETEADGIKRAKIKEAEGIGKGKRIVADANAYKIKVENESARKYFKGNAQILKQLEVTRDSLEKNSKIVLTEKGISPVIVLGNENIIPIKKK